MTNRTITIQTGPTGSAPYRVTGTVYPERQEVEVASQISSLREAKRIAAAWRRGNDDEAR